jgi:hypothetical protein
MMRAMLRTMAAACAGAAMSAVCLLVAFGRHPVVSFDLDGDAPPTMSGMSGVYPTERDGRHAFVWTRAQATFNVPGLDRHTTWSCTTRFRGARPDAATPEPDVAFAVDGITVSAIRATNEYQSVIVVVPAKPAERGLTLTLVSTPTFRPGVADSRELGVQLDLLSCRPDAGWITPSWDTMVKTAFAGAVFGAAISLTGLGAALALLAMAFVAVSHAALLAAGLASYGAYPTTVVWLAVWIAGLMVVSQRAIERWGRAPFPTAARCALVVGSIALFLNLAGLFHPSKSLTDVVFQAHRLGFVLSGNYFFTQPMPNGVEFPYAIGLFVFAAPWSVITRDHVALLRVVVCATNAIAGLLLYPVIVRSWGDRLAGALAVLLFGVVPIWFSVVGNANLPNAFGQSVATIALVAIVVWPLGWPRRWTDMMQVAALLLVVSLAFLSHVSTVSLLSATLVVAAVLFAWRGGAAMRVPALVVLVVTIGAGVIAVMLYYGHHDFIAIYRKALSNVQASTGQQTSPVSARTMNALSQFVGDIGWPIIVLAVLGAWRTWTERAGDRLVLVIAASVLVCAAVYAQNLLTPVDTRFERYAAEFLGRVDDATYPVIVIVAARGASWSWRTGSIGRVASGLLVIAAVVVGARAWLGWF